MVLDHLLGRTVNVPTSDGGGITRARDGGGFVGRRLASSRGQSTNESSNTKFASSLPSNESPMEDKHPNQNTSKVDAQYSA